MARVGGINLFSTGIAQGAATVASTRTERLWHVFWAACVTAVLAFFMLLTPLDWMVWSLQSRLGDRAPSGEFVFVRADGDLNDPNAAQRRNELAKAITRLQDIGAARVFVDFPLSATGDADADAQFQRAAASLGARLTFVNRIELSGTKVVREVRTAPSIAAGHPVAWSEGTREWPSFTWSLPFAYQTSTGLQPSLAARLAQKDEYSTARFQVDYRFRSRSIATVPLRALIGFRTDATVPPLKGKTVVIGQPRDAATIDLSVPGQATAPGSFVSIYAAESLIEKPIGLVPALTILSLLIAALIAAALTEKGHRRATAYAIAGVIPLYGCLVAPGLDLRVELAYAFPLLALFAFLRWRANWKHRIARLDPDTGLTSLRALARQIGETEGHTHVVVAKVQGYEGLLRSLNPSQRASYVLKLVERLRVGDPKLDIFAEGHLLAWTTAAQDDDKLREHLEGLRAIFAAPVQVDKQAFDVGITFGAAAFSLIRPERALPAAVAAVEETNEALEPVRFAVPGDADDTLWDLSLRARIDSAMEAGEVFCVYQPKVDLAGGHIVGVEALVRWEDPERGFIPPLHFVMQCEKAGRMEYLTRYVLQSACSAGQLLHFSGNHISMSVNISATLLTDMRIVGIVRNVLQATSFDPGYLTLEITETARLHNLAQARRVLTALKGLGTKLSMDDFGVGAANFETLQELPFDEVKIDRHFVSRAVESAKARAIVQSIIELGAQARIDVVAEGAESQPDLAILRSLGCAMVQGYAIARPMPLTNLLSFCTNQGEARAR